MIKHRGTVLRRDSTLFHIPFYPQSIKGRVLRDRLMFKQKCQEVTCSDPLWWAWLKTLQKDRLIFQTKDSYYSRPRTPADLEHAYTRRLPRRPPPGATLASQLSEANEKLLFERDLTTVSSFDTVAT